MIPEDGPVTAAMINRELWLPESTPLSLESEKCNEILNQGEDNGSEEHTNPDVAKDV